VNLQTQTNQGFAPVTLDEAMRFSDMLAKSQMVPKAYQGKPEDVLVAIQWGRELGLAPLQALQNIACINGKPSVYGDAAMALVQASPVCEDIEEYFEGEGSQNPVAICVAKRKGRTPVTVKFSVEDAKRAGLWGKQGPWTAYPKRMMQMRARGFALRDAFPDVLKGLITVEEAQDFPGQQERDITPAKATRNPLDALPKPEPIVALPDLPEPAAEGDDGQRHHVEVEQASAQMEEEVAQEPEGKPDACHHLFVPGKDEPVAEYSTLSDWAAAYEVMADKTARAKLRPPRERMTALRQLKEANESVMKKITPADRINHTAAYSKRLATLGAMLEGEAA
jgi:hypothetical protein